MKKRFILFLTFCSIMVLALGTTVFAAENDSDSFYVMSESCPEEAISYVKNNLYLYICDISVQDEKYADINASDIILGSPFTILKEDTEGKDIYYFPIIYENEIKFTIRVYEDSDGEYTGIFSEYLASELEAIADLTSEEFPLTLFMNNGNIMGTLDGNTFVFFASPIGNEVADSPSSYASTDLTVTDIKEHMDYDTILVGTNRATTSKYLYLDLAETQGNQTWCSAFAGSAIIRYKTSNKVYAKDIMSYYYPSSSNLESETITHSQLIAYAKLKGCSPSKNSGTFSQSAVVVQIDSSQPLYLSCVGSGTYSKTNHALVLRGYNLNAGIYSVWNPWNSYYETMSISTHVYAMDSSSSFTWAETIYGW